MHVADSCASTEGSSVMQAGSGSLLLVLTTWTNFNIKQSSAIDHDDLYFGTRNIHQFWFLFTLTCFRFVWTVWIPIIVWTFAGRLLESSGRPASQASDTGGGFWAADVYPKLDQKVWCWVILSPGPFDVLEHHRWVQGRIDLIDKLISCDTILVRSS